MNGPTRPDGAARSGLAGHIAWLALLALIALCAVGLELDRETRRKPELAPLVPEPFRGFAWPALIGRDFEAGNGPAAEAQARKFLSRRPVPAEHLSVLAVSASQSGHEPLAVEALGLSASRGWREPLAQAAVADAAIAARDWPTALQRVAALWSTGSRGDQVARAFGSIVAAPEGRAQVASWLKDKELERDRFLYWGLQNLDPESHSAVIKAAVSAGAGFDCAALSSVADQLLRRGLSRAAGDVWSGPCAAGTEETAGTFGFVASDQSGGTGPFGWAALGSGTFARDKEGDARAWTLSYANGDPGWAGIARRAAALTPGHYSISIEDARVPGTSRIPFKLRIMCVGGSGKVDFLAERTIEPGASDFVIPGEDCAVQEYELRAPRGSGRVTGLKLLPRKMP